MAQETQFCGQGGGNRDPGVLALIGDGKKGVELEGLGDLDVVVGVQYRWEVILVGAIHADPVAIR
jgi:hypothetical protein